MDKAKKAPRANAQQREMDESAEGRNAFTGKAVILKGEGTAKNAQWVKHLLCKAEDLSLIPSTQQREGERSPQSCPPASTHTGTPIHVLNNFLKFFFGGVITVIGVNIKSNN